VRMSKSEGRGKRPMLCRCGERGRGMGEARKTERA
jgi:hypothetical protein